jgi:uncharacterized protein (TIGR03000 family)
LKESRPDGGFCQDQVPARVATISPQESRTMNNVLRCCAFLGFGFLVLFVLSDTALAKSIRSGSGRSTNATPVYVYPATRAPAVEEDYTYGDSVSAANIALIRLRVPANAEVTFDGDKTSQTGALRSFMTPELERGNEYSYEIRARWMNDGKPVEQTRKVNFRPGDRFTLDFRP